MKAIHFLVGVPVAIIGATWLFWFGLWWDAGRPAGWPAYTMAIGPFHHTFKLADGYGAKYRAREKAEEAAARHSARVVAAQSVVTAVASRDEAVAQVQIRTVTRTITKEVPVYVTAATDARLPLSVGLVRVLDAGALGVDVSAVPGPAGLADDAPSPVASSVVAASAVDDFGICRANAERLSALQAWVTAEAQASAAP